MYLEQICQQQLHQASRKYLFLLFQLKNYNIGVMAIDILAVYVKLVVKTHFCFFYCKNYNAEEVTISVPTAEACY